MEKQDTRSGAETMRQLFAASPFVGHLGMRLEDIQPGLAILTLPFAESLITVGTIVHGGAIASLIDTAATAAAWSDALVTAQTRGTTVGLTISYLAAAKQEDLQATAKVLRHGQSLVTLDVEVRGLSSGAFVAKGLVTYKLG